MTFGREGDFEQSSHTGVYFAWRYGSFFLREEVGLMLFGRHNACDGTQTHGSAQLEIEKRKKAVEQCAQVSGG